MSETSPISKRQLSFKLFCATLLMFIALIVPAFLIKNFPIFENPSYNHLAKSISIGLIVIIGILFLRRKLDKGHPEHIGLNHSKTALKYFLIGIGLILVPVLITLIASSIFGLADFRFNFNAGLVTIFFLGFISTFFTDALSEELIFRGYIYSNLKAHFNLRTSFLITLGIFVIAPVFLITIQNSLQIQGAVPLSGGYIINLILFGAFMQYLRIIFKSIWVGVGFHLVFVHMNQLMGITNDKILQFSEDSNHQAVQIVLICLLVITFLALFIYHLIKGRRRDINIL